MLLLFGGIVIKYIIFLGKITKWVISIKIYLAEERRGSKIKRKDFKSAKKRYRP